MLTIYDSKQSNSIKPDSPFCSIKCLDQKNQTKLIFSLIDLVAYREFDNVKYIKGNVAVVYTTKIHLIYILVEVLPLLLIWSLIIPLYLINILRKAN